MKGHLLPLAVALTLTACGGSAAPKIVADPARGLVALTADDPRVDAIAVAADRDIRVLVQPMPLFGGVYVDGRRAIRATNAVARATGLTATSGTGTPKVECRAQNMSTGQSISVPCPPAAVAAIPRVLSFIAVRATADSAYVGVLEADNRSSKSSCMTLTRAGTDWKVLGTSIVTDAKHCGR